MFAKNYIILYYIISGLNFVEQEVIKFRSPNKLKGRKTHTTKIQHTKSLARNVLQRALPPPPPKKKLKKSHNYKSMS
jgi:hypothetical protein